MWLNIMTAWDTQADNFNDWTTTTQLLKQPTTDYSLQIQKNWLNLDTHLGLSNYAFLHKDEIETIVFFELTVLELYS